MIESKTIFLDTAPIIYYLQRNELFFESMELFWRDYCDCEYITSAVTVTEYLVYPYRQKNEKLIKDFYSFFADMDIKIVDIDRKIAEKAAWIRGRYPFFKTMDALQLATACMTNCDLFLTNDKQLKQFNQINSLIVEELKV